MKTVKAVHTCHDRKCSLGITSCEPCNGFGRVNPKGKKYRHEVNIPTWAVDHEACNGKGLIVCSERDLKRDPLADDERATLGLPAVVARKPRTRKAAPEAA